MVDDDNRFHADSVAEWHAAVDEVEASTGPAALVTTGTGKFYSNGFALERLIEEGTIGEVIPSALRLFARLLRLPVYTVAALNGHAFAAGGMIAMAHDARVMRADRGYWCLPEADMGVPLAPGMTQLIAAKLPAAVAHAAIMTARRWGGSEAVADGIVDEAVAEDEVLARAVELAAGPGRHQPGGHRGPAHRHVRPPARDPGPGRGLAGSGAGHTDEVALGVGEVPDREVPSGRCRGAEDPGPAQSLGLGQRRLHVGDPDVEDRLGRVGLAAAHPARGRLAGEGDEPVVVRDRHLLGHRGRGVVLPSEQLAVEPAECRRVASDDLDVHHGVSHAPHLAAVRRACAPRPGLGHTRAGCR